MQYLSRQTLESLNITTAEVLDALEKLVRDQAAGKAHAAPKTVIVPGDGRYMMATLSTSDEPPMMAVKSVLLNQENSAKGGDAINASITLTHSQTGETLAIMDGNWITGVRTAAASVLAARYLAKKDSAVVAFIGCGVQAHSHLKMLADLYPLRKIHALGKGVKNRDLLCDAAQEIGLEAVASENAQQAVESADIVVSSIPLTSQVEPFIDADWLKPGAFIASTDSGLPWKKDSLDVFDRLVIDDLKQEAAMPVPMMDMKLIDGDLTGLMEGKVAARQSDEERTAFIFRAVALGDLALATLVYQKVVG